MIRRTSRFIALAFALAAVPAFLHAQPAAADSLKGAVMNAAGSATGLQSALAGGDFKMLNEALTKTDLVGMISKGGPYTIFAPTDAAFKKIPEADLKKLMDNPAELKKVLQNHVVKGKVSAEEAAKMDGQSAKTEAGTEVPIKVVDGKVHFGSATVTKPDVSAGNSVVHVVDTVVMPTGAAATDATKASATENKDDSKKEKDEAKKEKDEAKKDSGKKDDSKKDKSK